MQLIGGSKRFPGRHGRDDRWLFTDLELSTKPGEVLALMGPSGSGKSTLLRVLAGLDELTGGTLHRPERVGLVFQDPLLLPWRNVAANIALGLSFRANAEAAAKADVEAVAAELGIGHLLQARVDAISGGEAQRVALARAVLTEPELLLLGTGATQQFPSAAVMAACLQRGIGLEVMTNAAAARTYSVLASEGRRVVAGFMFPA